MSEVAIYELLLFQLFLIFLNAVFACAEIAVISINETKLKKRANEGDKRAVRLLSLTKEPAKFLATIQIGITLTGFLGSAFAADNFSDKVTDWLVAQGVTISPNKLDIMAVIGITLILSYVTLILGELVPKRIAMKYAEKIGLNMSMLIYGVACLFKPLVWLLTVSTNGVLRLLGISPEDKSDGVTEEEIRTLIDAGSENGTIDDVEKTILHNVFEFDDKIIEDVMTHRTDVCFLNKEDHPDVWEKEMLKFRHSIYPIFQTSTDHIVGTISFQDYFEFKCHQKIKDIDQAIKQPQFISVTAHINDLFQEMQRSRNHFAVVVDEYGGVDGIVTMNDLLEELVGDLDDGISLSSPRSSVTKIRENTWLIKGSTPIQEVEKELKIKLPNDEVDTFAGFILALAGPISPARKKSKIQYKNIRMKIIRSRGLKIEEVLVQKIKTSTTKGK